MTDGIFNPAWEFHELVAKENVAKQGLSLPAARAAGRLADITLCNYAQTLRATDDSCSWAQSQQADSYATWRAAILVPPIIIDYSGHITIGV